MSSVLPVPSAGPDIDQRILMHGLRWTDFSSRRQMAPWMPGPLDAVHHDTVEVCLIEEGVLRHRVPGAPPILRAGEVVVVAPGVVHSSWTEGEGCAERIVHLDAARVGPVTSGVWAARERWPDLWRAVGEAGPATLADATLALVRATQAAPAGPLLGDVRLARVAAMSPAHFSRRFAAATGLPPMSWVLDQRVARAAWLIATTDHPIGEIAAAVGFGSSSRLTEAFQRRRGISPSAWRAAQQG